MIIIDSVSPVEHGRGSVRSIYTLYADTMDEVPLTGAETKPLISGLEGDLPPTTLLYTGDYQIAVLDTYDHWRWKSESEDDTNVFYVYHSGRPAASAIETVHITSYIEEHGYDLTRNLTRGTYYGGYALPGGVTPSVDPGGAPEAYDGTNWTWTTMETDDGRAITPVADAMYIVREVPGGYLKWYIQEAHSGGKITSLLPLTGIDATNYSDIGFYVNGTKRSVKATLDTSQDVTVAGQTIHMTVDSLFGDYGVTEGYLGYYYMYGSSVIKDNASFTFRAYLVSPDGVETLGSQVITILLRDRTFSPDTGIQEIVIDVE